MIMMHIRKCLRKGVSFVFLAALCVAAAVFPAVAVEINPLTMRKEPGSSRMPSLARLYPEAAERRIAMLPG